MLAAAFPDDLVVGLVLGFLLGLVAGPLMRSWLVWREWSSASREADLNASHEAELIADVLDRMEADGWPPAEDTSDPPGAREGGDKTPRERWQPRH